MRADPATGSHTRPASHCFDACARRCAAAIFTVDSWSAFYTSVVTPLADAFYTLADALPSLSAREAAALSDESLGPLEAGGTP